MIISQTVRTAYEKAVRALIQQNTRSRSAGSCMYRASSEPGCNKCFIGHMLADEQYYPELEGNAIDMLMVQDAVDASLGCELISEEWSLLDKAQGIHDMAILKESIAAWPVAFAKLATRFDPDWTPVFEARTDDNA
tara:strand:+ start:437 stop:844 length:408 start_codon:yes stop_codon:yes gene_type:complete